jgi:hypothetical protein
MAHVRREARKSDEHNNKQGRLLAHPLMVQRRAKTREAMWDPAGVQPLEGTTLYEHLRSLLSENARGPLPQGGAPLPDEVADSPDAGWIAGGYEGVLSLRAGGGSSDSQEPLLAAAAILEAARRPLTTTSIHVAAERLTVIGGPQAIDRMLRAVHAGDGASRMRIAELARWLCRFGVTCGQVKSGIALLGLSGSPRDVELISSLGLLEDLTLYSVVALKNLLPEPTDAIFEVAKQVMGWGRIHAVYKLRGATHPQVRDWLLRGGYDNDVIVEELAFIAATTGGLAAALQGEVDDELLDHAGVLLAALATGGPAEDMSDYASAELALRLYFEHIAVGAASVRRFRSLRTLRSYLDNHAEQNPQLTAEATLELSSTVHAILDDERWVASVVDAFSSEDVHDFHYAIFMAPDFGLNARPAIIRRLRSEPVDWLSWHKLAEGASRDEVIKHLALARSLLPLDSFELGASADRRYGEARHVTASISTVVDSLGPFPGEGWSLVQRGLQAAAFTIRSSSIGVIEDWPREFWPQDAVAAIKRAAEAEPLPRLQDRLRALLMSSV